MRIRNIRLHILVGFALALSVLEFGASLSMGASPPASQDMELQVTQCSNGDPDSCDQSTDTVTQEQQAPSQHVVEMTPVAPQPAPKPQEVHTYSLKTGKGSVTTSDGSETTDTLKVDPQLKKPGDDNQPAVAEPGPAPTVTTQGGSGYTGFDFVTRDKALAQFAIPPFLLPIYVSAGRAYGIPWNVLAAINSIETNYGRNLNVSSAGAVGWMQFMPGTWKTWGVDASGDGYADPYNPVDAIYASARYLREAGGSGDLPHAIFAYNHADWYVDQVLKTAGVYGSLPSGLVGETSTLAYGHFPVRGPVRYGDDFRAAQLDHRKPVGLLIHARPGASVLATQDVTVERLLLSKPLAQHVKRSGSLPKQAEDPTPASAPATVQLSDGALAEAQRLVQVLSGKSVALPVPDATTAARHGTTQATSTEPARPAKPRKRGELPSGYGVTHQRGIAVVVRDDAGDRYTYSGLSRVRSAIRPGTKLAGGTTIGTLASKPGATLTFAVRAAGNAPVDPRPLVDGYRLQEVADLYNAVGPMGSNPFVPKVSGLGSGHGDAVVLAGANRPGVPLSQTILDYVGAMSKIYGKPIVISTGTNHNRMTVNGNVSDHWDGHAADLGMAANGAGDDSPEGDAIMTACLELAGVSPEQARAEAQHGGLFTIATPQMRVQCIWKTMAGGNHHNHVHVGVRPNLLSAGDLLQGEAAAESLNAFTPAKLEKVAPKDRNKLSKRLEAISNPTLTPKRSPAAVKVTRKSAPAPKPTRDLSLAPTAAGATLTALSVPANARGDETYALGLVDGSARSGWAKRQVVALRYASGAWTLLGPPRDKSGKVQNPSLRALSVLANGKGYAVGDKGAVVLLRRGHSPLLLPSATKARMNAVAVTSEDHHLRGYAVGSRGVAQVLAGTTATPERVAPHVSLSSITLNAGSPTAAGWFTTGKPAVFRRDGSWHQVDTGFRTAEGTAVRLTSITHDGDNLWVAGGIVDNPAAGAAERPFAAESVGDRWATFCSSSPALAAVVELGRGTSGTCDNALALRAGETGPADSIAATDAGIVLATGGGLQLFTDHDFRPVVTPSSFSRADTARRVAGALGLQSTGDGFLLGADGRLARIAPTDQSAPSSAQTDGLPWGAGGKPGTVAVAPGGDRALALNSNGDAALLSGGEWQDAKSLGVGLRDVAFAGSDKVWGLDAATGSVVSFDGKQWSVPGSSWADSAVRAAMLSSLGADVDPGGHSAPPPGLNALAFRSSSDGYAVGDHGIVAHYDGGSWQTEIPSTASNLHTVAAGPGGVIAAGDDGTLLERDGSDWSASQSARTLANGQAFTAAAALPDGTMLAVAGGTVLMKPRSADWQVAPVQPLGQSVTKIAGARDASGNLRVLALTGPDGAQAALQGDQSGWRSISDPGGADVATFGFDPRSKQVLMADGAGWAGFANLNVAAVPGS